MSERQAQSLENLEALIASIHDAKNNNKIIEAYKMANFELKKTYEDSGLTPESIEDELADVKEVPARFLFVIIPNKNVILCTQTMSDHNEIQETIASSQLDTSLAMDDTVLEQELNELMAEEVAKNKSEQELNASIERRLQELKSLPSPSASIVRPPRAAAEPKADYYNI